jgi:predicted membrane protein
MKTFNNTNNHSSRMWSGLILLIIGCVFFLRNFGITMPHWVFSWHTILVVIGLAIGAKRNFQGNGWLIMVLIGGYFTLQDIADISFSRYGFAIALVAAGLFLILKPSRQSKYMEEKKKADFGSADNLNGPLDETAADQGPFTQDDTVAVDDFVDVVNVFSGSKQHIYSKKFKGGEVVSIFGGCDLNLSQADFTDTVVLEVTAIFGGVKIIVPPTWTVKSDVTAIFGGLDDKRSVLAVTEEPRKIIIIKGLALFGGVDIRNF